MVGTLGAGMQGERQFDDAMQGERFMALYSSHQRRLFHYTTALLPNASDADDVFQEVNLVLWQKFDQYQEGTNFFAWACRIARYKVLQYHEKHAGTATLLDPDVLDRLADLAVQEIESFDQSQRQSLIDCIAQLSPGDRELVQHRYAEAMAVQAIARAMNRSPNAVSKSLGRIRRLLLKCITGAQDGEDEGGSPS
jgi:RNA polymerase sigma-70 factor (ECF subfamily)